MNKIVNIIYIPKGNLILFDNIALLAWEAEELITKYGKRTKRM